MVSNDLIKGLELSLNFCCASDFKLKILALKSVTRDLTNSEITSSFI